MLFMNFRFSLIFSSNEESEYLLKLMQFIYHCYVNSLVLPSIEVIFVSLINDLITLGTINDFT